MPDLVEIQTSDTNLTPATYSRNDQNPARVYLAGLTSQLSRITMAKALQDIAEILTGGACDAFDRPWQVIRFQHTAAIRAELQSRHASATVNKKLSALRGVLIACRRLGLMSAEDCLNACDVQSVKSNTLPRGRSLSAGEIRALFEQAANGTIGGRLNAALLAVAYGSGLRRSEIVGLDVTDFDPDTGALTIRCGKGRKDRITYLSSSAIQAVNDWLEIRGEESGPLFCPTNKSGGITIRKLTAQAIYNRLKALGARAGVLNFSPHDLRRTFCGDLLNAGADISLVQKLMGHSNVQTTQRYDRRPEEAKRAAAQLLRCPYVVTKLSSQTPPREK